MLNNIIASISDISHIHLLAYIAIQIS